MELRDEFNVLVEFGDCRHLIHPGCLVREKDSFLAGSEKELILDESKTKLDTSLPAAGGKSMNFFYCVFSYYSKYHLPGHIRTRFICALFNFSTVLNEFGMCNSLFILISSDHLNGHVSTTYLASLFPFVQGS